MEKEYVRKEGEKWIFRVKGEKGDYIEVHKPTKGKYHDKERAEEFTLKAHKLLKGFEYLHVPREQHYKKGDYYIKNSEEIKAPTLEEALKKIRTKKTQAYTKKDLMEIAFNLEELVETLHDNKIVHGDINATNIHVRKGKGSVHVWLRDFGFTRPQWKEMGEDAELELIAGKDLEDVKKLHKIIEEHKKILEK